MKVERTHNINYQFTHRGSGPFGQQSQSQAGLYFLP
jgi:hypothetical protein